MTLARHDGNEAVTSKQHKRHTQPSVCGGSDALSILKGH